MASESDCPAGAGDEHKPPADGNRHAWLKAIHASKEPDRCLAFDDSDSGGDMITSPIRNPKRGHGVKLAEPIVNESKANKTEEAGASAEGQSAKIEESIESQEFATAPEDHHAAASQAFDANPPSGAGTRASKDHSPIDENNAINEAGDIEDTPFYQLSAPAHPIRGIMDEDDETGMYQIDRSADDAWVYWLPKNHVNEAAISDWMDFKEDETVLIEERKKQWRAIGAQKKAPTLGEQRRFRFQDRGNDTTEHGVLYAKKHEYWGFPGDFGGEQEGVVKMPISLEGAEM
ncbi:hypothetical protein K402DRAFT_425708 [Aulographum hederae CBS 113979]|uniref:Uncharacterized protein n=1 Tax=Aulographum hederae CBS 113979 TaxID=1176131 RepID=A0A6G1GK06_9PEZI|nr:hypothetical protein K402DRAFT_425708 [Aulographum hederae CBS 113979]